MTSRHLLASAARAARALGLVGALVSCDTSRPMGCDVCTTSAIVFGTVRDAAGATVPGASVEVHAASADTTLRLDDVVVAGSPVRSDAFGVYRASPRTLVGPQRVRLTVRVLPPAGATLGAATVTGATVEVRDDYRGPARDSVRVDVVLPASASGR